MGEHDARLNRIYDAPENLPDEKAAQRKWDDRERIGFRQIGLNNEFIVIEWSLPA